jgi:isocitrate/isopropylmalate dehydrogenase
VNRTRTARVACLTGAGTAPELMAEGVLALHAVARLHGLRIDETHAAFGGVALARVGHIVPAATRTAILEADAVLVAGAEETALAEVLRELDIRAQMTHVRFGHHDDVVLVAPFDGADPAWSIERAFETAEARTLRLAAVGDDAWHEAVDAAAGAHEHVVVEHLSPRVAVPLATFNASRFDVVAVAPPWAEAVFEIAAATAAARVAAHGLLAGHGPSLFMPSPDGGYALAGAGVANPSSMLLAAALMLDQGLRWPSPAATLAGSVSAALVDGPQTPDLLRFGVGATSREFTDRVVDGFQLAHANAEFWQGAA